MSRVSLRERFLEKVKKIRGGCWEWAAFCNSTGYGCFGRYGKVDKAHRVSYELFVGPIPKGMFVCHHCDNRKCVRPSHLFLGTAKDNTQDALRKGRVVLPDNGGVRNGMSKLTKGDIIRIRDLASVFSQSEIGNLFGIDQSAVSRIVNGKRWGGI